MADKVNTKRLRQLARAVTMGREGWSEFSMRVPAEPDRDADIVLSSAADEIEALRAELERAQGERDALQAFKSYVHQRLDDGGVPTHPDGEHSAAGCRVGDRMDVVFATIARQREWIESAGHRPECHARECAVCGYTQGPHEWGVIRMGHKFQPGPCGCGYAELAGG